MRITISKIRDLLEEQRVFLMGAGVNSVMQTGASYRDDQIINIQPGIRLEPYTTFWSGSGRNLVSMGAFSYTHTPLPHLVSVGRYTSIATGFKIMGDNHPIEWLSTSPVFYNKRLMMGTFEEDMTVAGTYQEYSYQPQPISIGNDVWIGENVTLAHGVSLGDGCVVASNAVVTKDVQPYTIVGGIPAKPIRPRFDEKTIDALIRAQWWRYSPDQISALDVRDPKNFAPRLASLVSETNLAPYQPKPLTYADFEKRAGQP